MAEKNPIVTSLPAYVDENKIGLIAKSELAGRTISMINVQNGVKDTAAINLMDVDAEFQDGSDCGFTPAGSVTLTQRKIATGQVKVNLEFCEKKFLGTYAQHQVRIAAGTKTLPFEQEFVNGIIADVQAKLEKAVWQGDTLSEDTNLNKFDGFVKLIDAAEGVIDSALEPGTTVYKAIRKVNSLIPTEARKEDTVIFVGEDTFTKLINEMIDNNNFHYSGENDGKSVKLPGFNVAVEAVAGLNGTNRIFAGRKSNFFYGCDMTSDEEKFEFWYSKDDRTFKLVIEFNGGAQVAFPDEIVKGTLS